MESNPWKHKPWWCQPWSIVLTTLTLIIGSWLLWKIIWLTVLIAIPVLIWMSFFLFIWPRLMVQNSILEPESSQDGR